MIELSMTGMKGRKGDTEAEGIVDEKDPFLVVHPNFTIED